MIYGSIYRFEGQVSLFNYHNGPCYRDLFPEPPPLNTIPSCAEGGVFGVLPGIIGSIQATEAVKIILGRGQSLSGKLFLYDADNMTSRTLKFSKNTDTEPDLSEVRKMFEDSDGALVPQRRTIKYQNLQPTMIPCLTTFQSLSIKKKD